MIPFATSIAIGARPTPFSVTQRQATPLAMFPKATLQRPNNDAWRAQGGPIFVEIGKIR
jgi:hypothetical protein